MCLIKKINYLIFVHPCTPEINAFIPDTLAFLFPFYSIGYFYIVMQK